MAKILILNEDPLSQRVYSNSLRKVGFDVEIQSGEIGLAEKLLGFKADVILVSLTGRKVTIKNVAKTISLNATKSVRVIYQFSSGFLPSADDIPILKTGAILKEGQSFEDLLSLIATLLSLESIPLLEKYKRILIENPDSDTIKVFGSVSGAMSQKIPDDAANKSRVSKYSQYLTDLKFSAASKINKAEVKKIQKELKKDWDLNALAEIDAAKREYVQALFKKK